MQRQFTIEIRVDYEDAGKNDVMLKAMQMAAQHVYAQASLLADKVKPQIVVFSDDFMSETQQIALLDDTIGKGVQLLNNGESDDSLAGMAEDLK